MNIQPVKVTTESGRIFEVPALFARDVYAVTPNMEFFMEGDPPTGMLPGCNVTHIPTGNVLFGFPSKRRAIGFCRWIAKNLPDYDPANPEDEAQRLFMFREIENVAYSFGGW